MHKNLRLNAAAALLCAIIPAQAWAFHIGLGDAVASQGVTTLKKATASSGYGFGPPVQFTVDAIQNPAQIAKVSKFHSCLGHPYPDQNSLNSGKHYFFPVTNSEDTGPSDGSQPTPAPGHAPITLVAPCNGSLLLASSDISANSGDMQDPPNGFSEARGYAYHFSCSGSQTSLRFFHLVLAPTIAVGQTVPAGTVLGIVDIRCTPYFPGNCSDFDIAVSEQYDEAVVDYFSKLPPSILSSHWPAVANNLSNYEDPALNNCALLYPSQPYNNPADLNDYPSVQ